jgi:hypothetical protein
MLRSNPSRENVVFGGRGKLGKLTDWLMCMVYVYGGFILVFAKLTYKLFLDISLAP